MINVSLNSTGESSKICSPASDLSQPHRDPRSVIVVVVVVVVVVVIYLFDQLEVLVAIQLMWTCYTCPPIHSRRTATTAGTSSPTLLE